MTIDQKNILLTSKERAICERVRATDEVPHSQRAQALLALADGLSYAEASERAGLTAGQVKYWLSKFRQQRTNIFPEKLQGLPESPQQKSARAPEKEPKLEIAKETTEEAQPAGKDEKRIKKSKKAKAKKKDSKRLKKKPSKKKKGSKKKVIKKVKDKKKKGQKKKKSKKVKKGKR